MPIFICGNRTRKNLKGERTLTKANLEQLIDLKKEIKEIEQKIRHEGISPSDNVGLLEKRKQMAAELEKEITKYINSVVDSRVRRIMQYKYVDGYTWSKIARVMHYDRSSPEKIVIRYLNKHKWVKVFTTRI